MKTKTAQFVIRQTKNFYGPETKRSLVIGDDGQVLTFNSAKEARSYIDDLDDTEYYTSNNESGRPDYTAINTKRLPAYLLNQI